MQAAHVTGGADISCVAGSDVVVVTAGARQKPGQTRIPAMPARKDYWGLLP